MTGDIAILTPPPPGYSNLNNDTSNTTFIDIVWDSSNFMFSPVIYQISLVLSRFGTNVPVMSPYIAYAMCHILSITVYVSLSLYLLSLSLSLPLPLIQVFQSSAQIAISGLVVWDLVDAGGVVGNYYVSVYDVTNVKKLLTSENVFVS